jgi:hypothetical protein
MNARPEDLFRIAHTDPLVQMFVQAWHRGEFRTFEEMLVSLCVQLAHEKGRLLENCIERMERQPAAWVAQERKLEPQ